MNVYHFVNGKICSPGNILTFPQLMCMHDNIRPYIVSGHLFTKLPAVLPPTLVNLPSREIGCHNDHIAPKLHRLLSGAAAEVSVKFHGKSLNPNLAASRLHEILRSVRLVNRGPGFTLGWCRL